MMSAEQLAARIEATLTAWSKGLDVDGVTGPEREPFDRLIAHIRADIAGEGCDCTELCDMGPTCPGGMLARLAGSGCWRVTAAAEGAS